MHKPSHMPSQHMHTQLHNLHTHTIASKSCARIICNMQNATESNIADVPSRWHEMSLDERAAWEPYLGTPVSSVIPTLADHNGEWTTYTSIAASLWKR